MASVVVIGAGMGGMAAAARLSANGHGVTVVEQAATFGGKVGRFEREGFVFDTGPSLLTLPAVYRDLFLKTAVRRRSASLEDNVGLIGLDPAFGYQWSDGTRATIPGSNTNRVAAALGTALGGRSEQQWQEFSRRAAAMWAATRAPFLEQPLPGGWQTVKGFNRPRQVRTVAPWKTLRSLGEQYLDDPRLRMFLDRYATYTGSDPRRAPAALAVIPFIEQTFGAWHIEGGVWRLAEALYNRCVERGIQFRFNHEVDKVLVENAHVGGVRSTAGEVTKADVVVANCDADQVYGRLLGTDHAQRARRQLGRAVPSLSGFALLLALRGRTPGLNHHNVFFPTDYEAEFDSIFGRRPRPVADPALYVCSPDDPAMRPDSSSEAWFVLVNAPPHDPVSGVDWSRHDMTQQYADHILSCLAARGLDVRDRLLWREVRTPAALHEQTLAPGGSIYGTATNSRTAALRRPSNRSPVRGLFLVGGSTHPGGGLPLVGMSAAIVSELIGN